MAKAKRTIDVGFLQDVIAKSQESDQLKDKIRAQVEKVERELGNLRALVAGEKVSGKRGRKPGGAKAKKQDQPKPGSAPARLCEMMSSTEPTTIGELARKTGLSEGTVKVYIHQFKCFQLAGRGKGYVCTAAPSTKSEGGEAKPKVKKKKAAK